MRALVCVVDYPPADPTGDAALLERLDCGGGGRWSPRAASVTTGTMMILAGCGICGVEKSGPAGDSARFALAPESTPMAQATTRQERRTRFARFGPDGIKIVPPRKGVEMLVSLPVAACSSGLGSIVNLLKLARQLGVPLIVRRDRALGATPEPCAGYRTKILKAPNGDHRRQ